jgi:polysaccharide export outer membrane protein
MGISTEDFDALQRLSLALAYARKDYLIQPGDELRVVVYRGATLPVEYQQQITVQPDGKIALVNIDTPTQAAGRTVDELQQAIEMVYAPYFNNDPTGGNSKVTVQFLTSQRTAWLPDQIYVTGEVARPLAVPYRRGMTTMQAISHAGGWRPGANETRVVIVRNAADGRTLTRELDLDAVIAHQGNDMELFPGDVVYVPRSFIYQLNIWVNFYVRGLLPINPSTVTTVAAGL